MNNLCALRTLPGGAVIPGGTYVSETASLK